ncbi:hypothetical protein CERSUDRAFT_114148 [Gelatoporia subvermispora B]|uniref:DUF6533 domain-containing protein n=1 Tax=Ceriporiopsis subvermispora (strain B) TaxID=914234 RepID=M2RGC8_CERS8|nr:hypothetical protein CERSUDRAFT_114148 [Gelatoporia subvermispora B]
MSIRDNFESFQVSLMTPVVASGMLIVDQDIAAGTSTSVIIFYDYALTVSQEVEYIWKREFSSVALLFGFNRFILLTWAGANMWIGAAMFDLSASGFRSILSHNRAKRNCTIVENLSNVCTILATAVRAAFTALRIYAIGNGQWALAIAIFVLSSATILIPIYQIITFLSIPWFTGMGLSCTNVDLNTQSPAVERKFADATLACTAVSAFVDLLGIVLTWRRTHISEQLRCASVGSLTDVLLREGALYFIVLLVLNVLAFLDEWNLKLNIQNFGNVLDIISQFQTPLLSITVSHFLLNLREVAYGVEPCIPDTPQISVDFSMSFSQASYRSQLGSFVEPMGDGLTHGQHDSDEDADLIDGSSAHIGRDGVDI